MGWKGFVALPEIGKNFRGSAVSVSRLSPPTSATVKATKARFARFTSEVPVIVLQSELEIIFVSGWNLGTAEKN